MQSVTVYHYDAFTNEPNLGNPAGLVLQADDLTEKEMQEIAFKIGFNETSFHLKSEVADLKIRYFTPGHEMNLCGHATVATLFALKSMNFLSTKKKITIETNAGILPILIEEVDHSFRITMKQASPQFQDFKGSKRDIAQAIGLKEEDISNHHPIVYGSTGIWTLLIPINSLEAFKRMKPHNQAFPSILKEIPNASVHPFCLDAFDSEADMHARHFSSPYSGTIEDAVTGTASGVMGAYYATYIEKLSKPSYQLIIEQGNEMNKKGKVYVSVQQSEEKELEIFMSGTAVYVDEYELLLTEKIL
ncbi:isomerase [Bacillus sp. TS-2]|nr:isomerase [Bacillus sp. TS-2]